MELVDFETYATDPFGHATAGDGWLRFYPSPQLAGFVIWGALGEPDIAALIRALEIEMTPEMHVTLCDVSGVKSGDPGAFRPGFQILDVSKPAHPREIAFVETAGMGVHRYDLDDRYAYISTEMPGYLGCISVIYDLASFGSFLNTFGTISGTIELSEVSGYTVAQQIADLKAGVPA